jgi:hypothetical protein
MSVRVASLVIVGAATIIVRATSVVWTTIIIGGIRIAVISRTVISRTVVVRP